MPNIDANTYFFTALVPIRNNQRVEHKGMYTSPSHAVKEVLEVMPTALQSPAAIDIGINSPFARNDRTHFARFLVLDDLHFNGRVGGNIFIEMIKGVDLLQAQKVDQLTCPYVMFTLVFDLPDNTGEGEPQRYFEELWGQMADELKSVFQYCYGFEDVTDGASFAAYMQRCQIETTMTLHDYWWEKPDIPTLNLLPLLLIPAAGLLLPLVAAIIGWIKWLPAIALAAGLTALAIWFLYRHIIRLGSKPYPASPGSDLNHVTKGLFLQQGFTRFVHDNQGADPAAQGAAFRTFLEKNKPGDIQSPTQSRGVVRAMVLGVDE